MRSPLSLVLIMVGFFSAQLPGRPAFAAPDSPFNRNDSHDFRGEHRLVMGGDASDFFVKIEQDADFSLFKLWVATGYHIGTSWWVRQIKVDMNEDNIWDMIVTENNPAGRAELFNYSYPQPAGPSRTYSVAVYVEFMSIAGDIEGATLHCNATTYATPRVYHNADNDAFVQLRNQDCTNKIPLLIVEGFDPLNRNYPAWYYQRVWDLVQGQLYPRLFPSDIPDGYEVFILNFREGGGDLRDNATVVSKALAKVHEICPNSPIVLAGLSMGGVISRYTLAKMESQGLDHHVKLFVSFDAPQMGANINLGLQNWIKDQDRNRSGAIAYFQDQLSSQAAKQLLLDNAWDPVGGIRRAFYDELNALNGDGYPHLTYNVAISNGNLQATHGYEHLSDPLMRFTVYVNSGTPIPPTTVYPTKTDLGPGSMFTNLVSRRVADIFGFASLITVSHVFEIFLNPVFIPTWSALHLTNKVIDEDTGDITDPGPSRFNDTHMEPTPLMHAEVGPSSRDKIMSWLGMTVEPVVVITSPVGGEHWMAGSRQTVRWMGAGSFNILGTDGVGWVTLATGVQNGSTVVTMPAWNTTRARMKVVQVSTGRFSQSPGTLTVVGVPTMTWSIRDVGPAGMMQSVALALADDHTPYVAFSDGQPGAYGRPMFARPIAGGWYPENPFSLNNGAFSLSIAADALGNPHMAYVGVGGRDLGYLTRADGVWSYVDMLPNNSATSNYSSLRLNAQGVPHIARNDNIGRLVVSYKDGNGNWVHPLVPNATLVTYPSLAMNAQSEPRVSYAETNGQLRYVERTGWNWSLPVTLSAYGHASNSSLTVDAQGNPKIAWYDPAMSDVRYIERNGSTWSSQVRIDYGQAPSLALDPSGLPRIAYYANGVLLYASRNAGGVWSITPADTSGDAGASPSLALNAQGSPHVAYFDIAAQRARYAVSPADEVRPADVSLSVSFGRTTAVVFWDAPGDDGTSGQAIEYDLRYSPNWLSDATFASATRIPIPPPGYPGSQEGAAVDGLTCGQAYSFALKTRDDSGNWGGSNTIMGAGDCGDGREIWFSGKRPREGAPATLTFSRSSPNPTAERVVFRVGVPEASRGAREELALFDLLGRRVRSLVSRTAVPGWQEHTWDLRTDAGSRARAGVYFMRYHLGNETRRQSIVILD